MSDGGLIVHCPSCGQALMAAPKVNQCVLSSSGITVHFHAWGTEHKCGPQ